MLKLTDLLNPLKSPTGSKSRGPWFTVILCGMYTQTFSIKKSLLFPLLALPSHMSNLRPLRPRVSPIYSSSCFSYNHCLDNLAKCTSCHTHSALNFSSLTETLFSFTNSLKQEPDFLSLFTFNMKLLPPLPSKPPCVHASAASSLAVLGEGWPGAGSGGSSWSAGRTPSYFYPVPEEVRRARWAGGHRVGSHHPPLSLVDVIWA